MTTREERKDIERYVESVSNGIKLQLSDGVKDSICDIYLATNRAYILNSADRRSK